MKVPTIECERRWMWQSWRTVGWYSLEKYAVEKESFIFFLKWLFSFQSRQKIWFSVAVFFLQSTVSICSCMCVCLFSSLPSTGAQLRWQIGPKERTDCLMFKNGRRVMFWSVNVILSLGYLSKIHSLSISLKGVVLHSLSLPCCHPSDA